MTDQERFEYIKILHDEANEIGKNGEKDSEEKIIDILIRLFYQAHTDFLIAQAERVEELEFQLESLRSKKKWDRKRMKEFWGENQRYKQALEFYANEDHYEMGKIYGVSIEHITDRGEIARQALIGDTNA